MTELGYSALKSDLDLPGSSFDQAEGYRLIPKNMDYEKVAKRYRLPGAEWFDER